MASVYLVVDTERSDYDNTYYLVFATMEGAQAHLRREALKVWGQFHPDSPNRRRGLDAYLAGQETFFDVQPLLD